MMDPQGKYYTKRQMHELFNIPRCVLEDSLNMRGSEQWCIKSGQGRTCKWLFKYDAFMKNYDEILKNRFRKA